MATIDVTLRSSTVCAGGDHGTVFVSLNSAPEQPIRVSVSLIRETLSDQDKENFIGILIRLSVQGLTRQEAVNKLLAGFQVVI